MDFKALLAWKRSIENMELKKRINCPIDGFPLETHPVTGELWCPFDGWPYQKPLKSGED